jgi:hypothetical protein
MFTGFASENTPAIQVWDFFRTFASTSAVRSVSLSDDCAPIQFFRTGATASNLIRVNLPTAPIEGKQLTIVNQQFGTNAQKIEIYSSDVNGGGTSFPLFTLGPADSIILVYSKQSISYGTATGYLSSGWISLNKTTTTSANYFSAVVGGDNNSAQQAYSFIGGGTSNTTSGFYSAIVGGQTNTINGSNSVITGGSNNVANGQLTVIAGGTSNATTANNSAVVGGNSNVATAVNSFVGGGRGGSVRSIVGNTIFPASDIPISTTGGCTQTALLVLGRETTNATATVLTSNTSAGATTNQVILPDNSAYYFKGSITAGVTGAGNSSMWSFEGGIKRGVGVGTTVLVGTPVLNVVAQDSGASTWVIALTADTTNGGLAVTVTGQAATTIRWVCKVETTEMTF